MAGIKFTGVGCSLEFRDAVREMAQLRGVKIYRICDELLPVLTQQLEKLRIQQLKEKSNGRRTTRQV